MRLFGSAQFVRHVAMAFGVVLAGFTSLPALAQQNVKQAAPILNLVGTGGVVEAAGAGVTVTGSASSVRAAGALVNVNTTSTGNVEVAGAQVSLSGSVGGNLRAAGATVDASGAVTGDAEIASAVSRISLTAGGHLYVGGASVVIAPGTDVTGELQAFGAVLDISGHFAGPVKVGGAVVTFNGQTEGAVEISGSRVILGPDARIGGNLTVRSANEPEVNPAAVVTGTTERLPPTTWWGIAPWQWAAVVGAAVAAGTVLAGIVLLLFGGQVFTTATEHVRHRPLSSFFFGILALVLIPFVAAILMVTVVGISIGFAILFILPLLIIFGHAVAAAGLAAALLVRRRGEIGAALAFLMLIIGAIVLVGIGLIPWVGPALVGLALVLGTGAFTRTLGGRIRRAQPKPMI
jgi:cytoskeletal protein CcmA (bactofilin family)